MIFSDTKESYNAEARRILDLLKRDFRLPDGALCLEKVGDQTSPHHIFPDLGDFLPFFLYFGEESFIDEQISLFKKTLMDGVLISEFPSFGFSSLAKSYEYSDLLFGLFDYNSFKNNSESTELLLKSAKTAIKIFRFDGRIKSFWFSKLKIGLPIMDTRDGTFVEFYVDMYKVTGDERYIQVAHNIYDNLISSSFYKQNRLFATFDGPIWVRFLFLILKIRKHMEANICKNNTNSLFGMFSLYSLTKDKKILQTIEQTVDSIKEKAIVGGGVSGVYSKVNSTSVASLTASFAMIDFLCDLYNEVGQNKYLELAEGIANYWIELQGTTGLFPFSGSVKDSFFDSETDMTVALLKLYELTSKVEYKEAADKCFNGIMQYHSTRDFVLAVNIDTGEVINTAQRTKFLALFLKLLILKIEILDGKKIYEDKRLWSLLKDR
ncbi:MAG TPA: hypothetical protein VJC13_02255 [Candidatus Paceibacterota bacterium]